jgi:hypothetical protein
MMVFALIALLLNTGDMFVVEASAGTSYTVALSRETLRTYVDDIGLFRRNMPGVVAVTPMGNETYFYQTEKDVPLSPAMKTDFVIRKRSVGDSVTVYESIDPQDQNYMFCEVLIRPADSRSTTIDIRLRLKLQRENASEVHWMAPLLGADFISRQMTKDMEEMLAIFVEKSNEELYGRLHPETVSQQ